LRSDLRLVRIANDFGSLLPITMAERVKLELRVLRFRTGAYIKPTKSIPNGVWPESYRAFCANRWTRYRG
jgi:hypothetical protein